MVTQMVSMLSDELIQLRVSTRANGPSRSINISSKRSEIVWSIALSNFLVTDEI